MSTVARSVRGTVVASLSFAVQMARGILIVPLMLEGWGASSYALWVSCQAAFGVLFTFDSGHQTYVGNEMAKLLPVDRKATQVVLGSALRFALVLGAAEIAFVVTVVAAGRVGLLMGLSENTVAEHRLAIVLALLVTSSIPLVSIGGVFSRLFPPAGHFVRSTWWAIVQQLSFSIVIAVAAWNGATLLATAMWVSAATLVIGAAFLADCARLFPELRPFWRPGTLHTGALNFARSLPITGSQLLQQLQTNGLVILLSASFGGAAVASFATLRTLANTVHQASVAVLTPAIPELVRFRVKEEHEKLRTGLFAVATLTALPAAIMALALTELGSNLYEVWTRHKIAYDRPVFHLLVATALWRIFGSVLVNHMIAMNKARIITVWAVGQSGTFLVTAFLTMRVMGPTGAAFGLLVGEFVGSFLIPLSWLYADLPESERRPLLRQQLTAALTPLSVTVALVGNITLASGSRYLVLASTAAVCIGLFLYQVRQLPHEIRTQAKNAVLRLLRSRK